MHEVHPLFAGVQNSMRRIRSATYLLCEYCCTADRADASQNYIEDLRHAGPAVNLL